MFQSRGTMKTTPIIAIGLAAAIFTSATSAGWAAKLNTPKEGPRLKNLPVG
jgi:hypothetical protein